MCYGHGVSLCFRYGVFLWDLVMMGLCAVAMGCLSVLWIWGVSLCFGHEVSLCALAMGCISVIWLCGVSL
jgi:hypothetical protein